MREMNPGQAAGNGPFDHYDYTSHMLNTTQTYATGTGYNEKNKMLVMVHSGDDRCEILLKQFTFSNQVNV